MPESPRPLSDAERLDWLRLIRSENVGPVTFRRLLERFGSAGKALDRLPDLARAGGRRRPITVCSREKARHELERAAAMGARALAMVEPDYPAPLRALDEAPPVLYVLGHGHLLSRPAVAVVGARNASANGRRFARRLAADLAGAGFLVVSGMARGIDTAAHEGALAAGTAAVTAGGVDVIYPPENADLHRRLCESGVALSEMPPGEQPQARHFPRRNRIISGLSLGVVVVEAAARSGSLITARLALEQGREVFAVPGSPLDPRAAGPNALLRQGAVLTEGADDVIQVLNAMSRKPLAEPESDLFGASTPQDPPEDELDKVRASVLEVLGPSPVEVDEIIRQCQLSAGRTSRETTFRDHTRTALVAMVLLELDLAGRLERHPGNRVSLLVEPG